MPWPAGFVDDRARERDQVGITGPNDRFGLCEICDQPDGNHRHMDGRFDRAGKRNLVARPDRNLLSGMEAAARDVDRVAATLLKTLGEGNGLLNIPPAL